MDRKNMAALVGAYVLWGIQPLYWSLMDDMDSMFIMACRVLWAAILLTLLLAVTHRLSELKALLTDKKKMKLLAPAVIFLLIDWGIFIWAVQAGHVLDTSLGYYMMPLVVFGTGILLFKERCGKLQVVAMLFVVASVAFNIIYYGTVPLISLILAFAFAIYGAIKKIINVDPLVSITAETIMMSPLAIIFILVFRMGDNGLASVTPTGQILLIASGIVTALPMILYVQSINHLPLLVMGFAQYISPTIGIMCGLVLGEQLTTDKLITFILIWIGLVIFSGASIRDERKKRIAEHVGRR